MRGPYRGDFPLPPTTDGFIKDSAYSYSGDDVVYAVREFPGTVQRLGAVGRWTKTRPGSETVMTMATVGDPRTTVTAMVHLSVTRSMWDLTIRRHGRDFQPVASGTFSPILAMDRDHIFEVEVAPMSVTVRVPGEERTANVDMDTPRTWQGMLTLGMSATAGLVSNTAFWEQYPAEVPAGVVFDYDTVWVAVQGEPLVPVTP